MATEIERLTVVIDANASNLQTVLQQAAGAVGIFATAARGISLAAEAEKAEVAFGVMLHSAQLGAEMMRDLTALAAETPLRLTDVQKAAQTLLQFGIAGKDIIPTLTMLGDTALGDANRFQHMALAFGQVKAAGRLMGQEVLQFINAGFNPLQEISRTTGKSMKQLKDEMRKGGITFEMVANAFKTATGPGGNFESMMAKMAKTTGGLFSTMQDDIDAVLRTFGNFLVQGLHLNEVMFAISAGTQSVAAWLKTLSPETVRVTSSVILITTAFVTLSAALTLLAPLLAAVLSPLTLIVAGIALVGAQFVENIGGWEQLWLRFSETTGITWAGIQNAISLALATGEFALKNFRAVSETVWTALQLGFIRFTEDIKHFFTNQLPVLLKFAADNWQEWAGKTFGNIGQFLSNLGQSGVNVLQNLPDAFRGQGKQVSDLLVPLTSGFQFTNQQLQLPGRQATTLETDLMNQLNRQAGALGEGFRQFELEKAIQESPAWLGPTNDLAPIEGAGVKTNELLERAVEQLGKIVEQGDEPALQIEALGLV